MSEIPDITPEDTARMTDGFRAERERLTAEVAAIGRWCREDERATLRAKVEALRVEAWDKYRSLDMPGSSSEKRSLMQQAKAYQHVLDLIDEDSDD